MIIIYKHEITLINSNSCVTHHSSCVSPSGNVVRHSSYIALHLCGHHWIIIPLGGISATCDQDPLMHIQIFPSEA